MFYKIFKNPIIQFILAVTVLLNKAVINGFPLLQAKSARIMIAASTSKVLNDLEGFYPFFVKYSSLGLSLWFTVIFQAALLIYALNEIYKIHLKENKVVKFVCLIFLVFLSNVDYFVASISPHIFALLSLLYGYLIFKKKGSIALNLAVVIISMLAVPIQSSIILIVGIILLLIKRVKNWNLRDTNTTLLIATSLISACLVSILNKKYEGSYYYLKNASIYETARAFDRQIAIDFLQEKCKEGSYYLGSINVCKSKKHLSYISEQKFIYNKKSPLFMGECLSKSRKTCWQEKRNQFIFLIEGLKESGKYKNRLRLAWLSSAIKQLFYYEVKPLPNFNFHRTIKKHYPIDDGPYQSSLQMKGEIQFTLDNLIEAILVVGSFLFFLVQSFIKPKKYLPYFFTIFGVLFINALAVTFFESASPHFQGRIVSIVCLALIISFFKSSFFSQLLIKLAEYLRN